MKKNEEGRRRKKKKRCVSLERTAPKK